MNTDYTGNRHENNSKKILGSKNNNVKSKCYITENILQGNTF